MLFLDIFWIDDPCKGPDQAGKYLFRKFLCLFVALRLPIVVGPVFMTAFIHPEPLEESGRFRRLSECYQVLGCFDLDEILPLLIFCLSWCSCYPDSASPHCDVVTNIEFNMTVEK